jgi:hypothetical protein
LVKAVEDALAPSIATGLAGAPIGAVGESPLEEEDINLTVNKPEDNESFIDIRSDKEKRDDEEKQEEPPDEREEFGIPGADETGRNVAFDSFKKIGSNVVDSYDVLGSDTPEDKEVFYDYLITNLKLYFDKFENDLSAVEEPTTDEYERQKAGKVETSV